MRRGLIHLALISSMASVTLVSADLPDADTLTWLPVPGAIGYNVYRSNLPGGLPDDYGICLVGSVQATSTSIAADPAVGDAYGYLVSSYDENEETNLGEDSSGNPRYPPNPCRPVRRLFPLTTNGDPGDGVEDGRTPRRNPSAYGWTGGPGGAPRGPGERVMNPAFGAGVYLPTGEFYVQTREHILLSRQVGTAVARTYRSQITYDGPFGHNWDSNLNARLVSQGSDLLFLDGRGRSDRFVSDGGGGYVTPAGAYMRAGETLQSGTWGHVLYLREPDGRLMLFHPFDGSNVQGALRGIEDRNGNRISLLYSHEGLLTTLVDTVGRALELGYDANGRITTITDWAGRSWAYMYDGNGDLASVRSPLVSGTPTGNDFPAGKTTTYEYSSGFADERLNHNLVAIIAPNEQGSGVPRLQNFYEVAPATFLFDRIVSQSVGGTNASGQPAGGVLSYGYASLNAGADPSDPALPRRLTTLIDRNGNQKEYLHNAAGNCLSATERTNREVRPGEPDYTTSYAYNPDGEIVEIARPEGNRTVLVYDRPGRDRYREGNLLEVRSIADDLAGRGRGDGHGGETKDVVTTLRYDPVFNQRISRTGPRGNDPSYVPQNGGSQSAARYRATWTLDYQEGDPTANGINDLAAEYGIDLTGLVANLGDVNGDNRTDQTHGNVVRENAPTVNLDPASNQAGIQGDTTQEIVTLRRWNDLGQITTLVDAEQNVHSFSYFPESDPDGDGAPTPPPPDGRALNLQTGGFLSSRVLDLLAAAGRDNGVNPTPATVLERFRYDAAGNLTHHIDGRGVLTRRLYNQLDQVVELRRAAATADSAGPDGDPATLIGEAGLTPFSFKLRWEYDANDNVVHVLTEDRGALRGAGSYVEHWLGWDILDGNTRREQELAPGSLVTQIHYDPNRNRVETILPAGNSEAALYDERDLLFQETRGAAGPRGGAPSTRMYSYDANGNLTLTIDGRGSPSAVAWDGHDRPARWTDPVGNTLDRYYDPAGHAVRELARGPIGGPSPTNQAGAANVDLSDVEYRYDELGRLFERRRGLFVPAGVVTMRTPVLAEGTLAPGDGATNQRMEHDRLGRLAFVVEDSGATTRFDYDGVGRRIQTLHPDGSSASHTYDDAHNRIETVLTEMSSNPGPPDEVFLTTWFHDALGRLTTEVDNLGHTSRLDYDSLDAVIAASDPNGPPGGTLERRSPSYLGTPVPVNDHGNVTRFQRDGSGRMRTVESILTASGLGDGTWNPPPDTANPHNSDGLLRAGYLWDADSLLATRIDDNGSTTSFLYDNLNRRIQTIADDGTITDLFYDGEDNPTTVVDANGSTIANGFDLANRRIGTNVVRAPGVEGTTANLYEYDGLGRMTRSTDNNDPASPLDDAEVRTFYDSLGRVIEEQQILASGGAKSVDYAWEAEGLLTEVVYPSGRQILYGYDAFDRLVAVDDAARPESASYDYLGMGRVHTRLYGNGVRATTLDDAGTSDPGFDGVQRLAQLRHLDAGNTLKAGFLYTYDAAGNRRGTVRPHDPVPGATRGELFDLDSGYRLTGFVDGYLDASGFPVATPPPDDEQAWALDGEGNWETMTRLGTAFLFTPSNMNEYDEDQSGDTRVDDGVPDDAFDPAATSSPDGLNHGHDKNGNLTDSGRHEHVFDYRNRLVQIRQPASGTPVATYRYDARDRRVLRDAPGAPSPQANRRYLYFAKVADSPADLGLAANPAGTVPTGPDVTAGIDDFQVLEERNPSDLVLREVISGGGRPLWQVLADGSSQYLHEDGQGSIVLLTEGEPPSGGPAGTPGAVLERITYDAFGKPTFESAANAPLRGRSGEYAAQSGYANTYLFGSLWYDPESGLRGTTPLTDRGGMFFGRGTWHDGGSSLMSSGGGYYHPDEGRRIARADMLLDPILHYAVRPMSFAAAGGGTQGPMASGRRQHGPITFAKPTGGYNPALAPSNLGTGFTPMHAATHKPYEIVVVGSKVKEVIREAGLRSDGELVQAAAAAGSIGSDRGKLTLDWGAGAADGAGASSRFVLFKPDGTPVRMRIRPLHDRLLVHPADEPASSSDKPKQSLYFPEQMLQASAISSLRTVVSSNTMFFVPGGGIGYLKGVADVEGYPDIAGMFKDTADGDTAGATGHAHGHLDYLKKVGDPATGDGAGYLGWATFPTWSGGPYLGWATFPNASGGGYLSWATFPNASGGGYLGWATFPSY